MNAHHRVTTAVVLAMVSLVGPSCVSTDQAIRDARLNQQEASQFRKAQTRTRAGGIATGAALGALAGGLIGGNWESAIAGAAVGGVAGGVAGEQKAQRQGQILVTERELDRRIAATSEANKRMRTQIAQMAADRKAYQQRISAAKAKNDKKALASIKREIKSNLSKADSSISSAQSTLKTNSAVSSHSSRLRTETNSLSSSVSKLQNERKLMASVYNSIDV